MSLEILAPLNDVDEVEPVIEAGADLLYLGVRTAETEKRFLPIFGFNARETSTCNFRSIEDAAKAIEIAHSLGVRVQVAYNRFYPDGYYPFLLREIAEITAAGADGLMVADPGLILALRELHPNLDLHMSALTGVFNREGIAFAHALGCKGVTLPRHVTPSEIAFLCTASREMSVGVFVLSERCPFVNAYCSFLHGAYESSFRRWGIGRAVSRFAGNRSAMGRFMAAVEHVPYFGRRLANGMERQGPPCLYHFDGNIRETSSARPGRPIRFRFSPGWDEQMHGCALCALRAFYRIDGRVLLKIVGRGMEKQAKIRDVALLKKALHAAAGNGPDNAFFREMRALFRNTYGVACTPGYCYYAGEWS